MGVVMQVSQGPLALIVALALGLFLPAPARAQAAYEVMAGNCGSFPGSPVYPSSAYASAQLSATLDSLAASRSNNRAARQKIDAAIQKLESCEKQEPGKFTVMPYMDCDLFVSNAKVFAANVKKLAGPDPRLEEKIRKGREQLKEQARKCVREVTRKCIDPQDTQAVLKAIETLRVAFATGGVSVSFSRSGKDWVNTVLQALPGRMSLRFCAETDFGCKGDKQFCQQRQEMIQRYLSYSYSDN
jgi:hypothetical protein